MCFRDPFEALKPGLISNYLPIPPHMAGDTEGSPDWLGLAVKGNPLLKSRLKREALSKIKLPLSLNNRHKNTQKPKTAS